MDHCFISSPFGTTLIAILTLVMPACASTNRLNCGTGERSAIHELLYFGAAKPKGTVTKEEWTAFLRDAVTPRFPEGLSVWQASGQWRSADGAILRETSNVLNLIHPADHLSEKAVLEIIDIYKSQFQQEAVLRVKTPACVSL